MRPSVALLAAILALAAPASAGDEPVVVRGHASAARVAPDLLPLVETYDDDVRAALGAPPKRAIAVDVVKNLAAARTLSRPWHLPEWAAGAARPDEGEIVLMLGGRSGRHDVPRVMKHELAHLALFDAAGGKRLPRWFDEGTARVLAGEHGDDDARALARARIAKDHFDLDALRASFPPDSESAARAYAISGRAITILVERHGVDVLRRVLGRVRDGARFDDALHAETAMRPFELSLAVSRSVDLWRAWATVLMEVDLAMGLAGVLFLVGAARVLRRRRAELEAMSDDGPPAGVAILRWRVVPRPRFA